jgi:rhomboid protease GluP
VVYFWGASSFWEPWMTRQGGAHAESIMNGEWWRTLTATTLHADAEHFLGNMLSGFFIFNLIRRRCGPGTFMVLLTLAAMMTNWTVAAISPPYYFSLGFSTVVFAGLGMLAGLETLFKPRSSAATSFRGLRNYTPLLGAFFLAVMVGLGEQVDIKGHFIGFGYGVLFAPTVRWLGARGIESPGWQSLGVLGVLAAYVVTWSLALR